MGQVFQQHREAYRIGGWSDWGTGEKFDALLSGSYLGHCSFIVDLLVYLSKEVTQILGHENIICNICVHTNCS